MFELNNYEVLDYLFSLRVYHHYLNSYFAILAAADVSQTSLYYLSSHMLLNPCQNCLHIFH